ncbi:MAG: hypothetical protein AAF292_16315 [Pseudomonadota bacterium]
MVTEVLTRMREGVADKRYSLTALSNASGVPIMTIKDMTSTSWQQSMFDRLASLDKAMDKLDGKPSKTDQAEAMEAAS